MSDVAKLFFNGRSQAVRLPKEYRFEGDEVSIRKNEETGEVILSTKPTNWDHFFKLREEAKDELDGFMDDRKQELPPKRDLF